MKKEYKYNSKGLVYGKFWGGGTGAYESEKLTNTNKNELLNEAEEMLKSGLLDSGMGFESLIGAILDIETIELITIDNKVYSRSEYEIITIGNITDEQENFLVETYYGV